MEKTRIELFAEWRREKADLTDNALRSRLARGLRSGRIMRVGRNRYVAGDTKLLPYVYSPSQKATDIADLLTGRFPDIKFSVFELVQLNDFLNHQIASNVIFVSVEKELKDFAFTALQERLNEMILVDPTEEMFFRYWSPGLVVLRNRMTEAPTGRPLRWQAPLEKILVDLQADRLLRGCFEEAELPQLYADVFQRYAVDRSKLYRYARRRGIEAKVRASVEGTAKGGRR